MSTRATPNRSKTLRYREEHSASVVLSWCILAYDISWEKICW